MKYLNSLADDFISAIQNDSYFDDKKVFSVFPYVVKPTELSKIVISARLKDVTLSDAFIGENKKAGEYSLFAHIYVPWKMKSDCITDVFAHICTAVFDERLISVSGGQIFSDQTTGSYVLKSVFTFHDEISFGGERDE